MLLNLQLHRDQGVAQTAMDVDVTEDAFQSGQATNDVAKGTTSWPIERIHSGIYAVKTLLPKTDETVGLLERWLIDMANLPEIPDGNQAKQRAVADAKQLAQTLRDRSIGWVVGTSLGFELVILSLAALIFCRRDY